MRLPLRGAASGQRRVMPARPAGVPAQGRPGNGGRAAASAVILGAVGGAGATTVACATALLSAAKGEPVTLVEFDLERGDLSGGWDVPAERTIDDLAAVADELGPQHVALVAHDHREGLRLLLGPRRPGAAAPWTEGRAGRLIDAASALGTVVVDGGGPLGDHVRAACTRLGRVVIVAPPTIRAARGVRSLVTTLRAWHQGIEIVLALNEGAGGDELAQREFARAVGHPVEVTLPRADRDADACAAGHWRPTGRGAYLGALERLAGQRRDR